ncbi:hypothetical protein WICMUC_003380 [Wickerhamomyces mucosus]|uniref:Ribosomal RNA-processing protein 17 n=1 Tax=Wickerhamomyces mucosus TaxID=1378264 RepID=A0A9P8PNB8_9ASCO|nr:hypothetical protein WICMUC_003380 [Wickerhamomyces mucosus]
MGKRTNRDILTGGKKYTQNKAKQHLVEEVVFDKDSRLDYLTGFHKRKLERQKKAQEYFKEQERLAKIEERKQIKLEKEKEMLENLEKYKETLKNINGDDDNEFKVSDDEENEEDEQEWEGIQDEDSEPKGILKQHIGEDEVIIEDLSDNKLEEIAKLNFVNLEKSEKILKDSIERARQYAQIAQKAESKPRKKKFRYLTKGERRSNKRKAITNKRRK